MCLMKQLWMDEAGFILSVELVLIATILILGMIVGLTTIRDQVVQELGDVALAIAQTNQSFSFSGVTGHHSSTAGSIFIDRTDDCDVLNDIPANEPACIEICDIPATDESGV